jgi:outer membrane protein assembly factor BamB
MLLVRPAKGMEIERLWTANAHMIMEAAPMAVDLDGDGDEEILTAAYQSIIAMDGTGEELWRFDTHARFSTCPAVYERMDGPPLIYAGDNGGLFTCLNSSGKIVWQAKIGPVFCSSPALADLNKDGKMEVIQGDKSGAVNVLDAITGNLLWKKTLEGECTSPAVGDLDGDGVREIVIATGAGEVFALNSSGETLWEFAAGGTSPDWATSSPVLFMNSKGQTCVAVASRRERIFCLDNRGKVMWEKGTHSSVDSSISAGDIDLDGRADLFAITELGVLYRFDEEGRVLWDIDTQGRSLASGDIIDMDGDGSLEYVLCTQNGNLLVFNKGGEVVFSHQFDNRTIDMTCAFGDIIQLRPGLEFAVTGGESGQIFCFGTSAPVDTLAQWRTYRCDNRLSGAWFGLSHSETVDMTPQNLGWDRILTGDAVLFDVVNPHPGESPLRAEASCARPDGSRQAAQGKVVGRHGVLQLPLTVSAPGVYKFEWALTDKSGKKVAAGSRELTLDPFRNDQALASRAVLALKEAIGEGEPPQGQTGLREAMRLEALAIVKEASALAFLQTAAPGSPPAFGESLEARTEKLNSRSKRALALAAVAPEILSKAPDSELFAFEGLTWENRDVDKQLPTESSIPLRITRRCVAGEHEPVSIKFLNVAPDEIKVGARVETEPDGPAATPFEVKPVATNQNAVAWDPLVPLGGGGQIAVPTLETREVWLDVDLAGVKPGTHPIAVTLTTGRSETRVEISLEVLPSAMAGYGAMRLCCWASYNDDSVKDLLAHGNNVFTVALPPAKITEGASPGIEIDFTELGKFVERLRGFDVYLLMTGVPSLGVPVKEADYVPRLADFLNQVMKFLADKGIDENHVSLYPYDEPGGNGWGAVNAFVDFGRQGLKARPGLKFYVNGGGDLPMFEKLNEIAAIWSPSYNMLAEDSPVMGFLRKSGKALWSYDCGYGYSRPTGANTKAINIAGQFRMAPVFGVIFGATGIGYWCYNVGASMWDTIPFEYPLVYVNPDGTHTSCRRWEAVREGMEDARILIALRERLDSPSISEAARAKIHHLLDQTIPYMARQSLEEVRLGVARYVLDTSNNDGTVEKFRAEMLDCAALFKD